MERVHEQEMVGRLREADSTAFYEVFHHYRLRLFGYLLRMSRRHDIAEDLLQDTFVRLAMKSTSPTEDTCLAAWLFTVARNLFLSYRRSRLLDEDEFHANISGLPRYDASAARIQRILVDGHRALARAHRHAVSRKRATDVLIHRYMKSTLVVGF